MLDGELAPLTGAPGELSSRALEASRASAALGDARSSLRHVRDSLAGQRSAAVGAAASRLTSVDERLTTCVTVQDGVSATLRRHAQVLADLQADARLALAERDAARARERRWQAEVDEARRSTWNAVSLGSPAPGSPALGSPALGSPGTGSSGLGPSVLDPTALGSAAPGDDPHLRLVMAERQLAAARADVTAAEARWRAARDTKAAESRRAAGTLGTFADVRAVRVASAAGMSAAQYRESAAHGQRAAALLPQAAASDDPTARREARADLRALLTDHRDDPAFWAMFWDDATPQQVYLALGVDPADPGDPLDGQLPGALGDGVAQWARTASATQRHELGHAVVADVGDSRLGLTVRAELAAALLSADLPAEVVAGAGDALDQRWDSVATLGAAGLTDATITAPLTAAVLTGYARHPRLAFDRLAPADDVGSAARRWLGWAPRDGWPDGGRAVTGAFAAAVEAGSTSDDRRDQSRVALLVSHATKELPQGLLSGPTLSDVASARVARAYEPYLASMGNAARSQTLDPSTDLSSARTLPPAPGIDTDGALAASTELAPPVVQPELDAFALRDVIAATSRTPEAAQAWLGTTDRYAASMVDVATSGAYDVNTGPRDALVQDTMGDVGAVAGAMQAETLEEAYDTVSTRESLISLTGIGVGVGTIGRTAKESLAAAAASTGLSFLDTRAPVAEAQATVGSVRDQTFHRYATTMHDLVLAHDLDHGIPLDRATRRTEAIDPVHPNENVSSPFGEAFTTLSQTSDDKETP